MFSDIYKLSEGNIEYLVKGKGEKTIVLLPPGVGRIEHFSRLIDFLSIRYKVVTFNFPGVGQSKLINPQISSIAKSVSELLMYLQIKEPILIGESYGGNVAIELSNYIKPKAIIFLASGEYFNDYEKPFLKTLFYPALNNPIVKMFYADLIKRTSLVEFKDLKDIDLNQIAKRWWEIIDYRLPKKQFYIPAIIFWPKRDGILKKGSLKKMVNIFPNSKVVILKCGHYDILKYLGNSHFQHLNEVI